MHSDVDNFRRHFAQLSDEALLELDRTELIEAAQKIYDLELAQRGLEPPPGDLETGEEPDWLDEAACACTFEEISGKAATDAADARSALLAAGIPCHISMETIEPIASSLQQRKEYRLMVPGALTLKATSVLDRDVFNIKLEEDWMAHFEGLSDEELLSVHSSDICAGLRDRIERLERPLEAEIARRDLGPSTES